MIKSEYRVLGIMSGTSLDGIDIAYLKFQKKDSWNFKIIYAETIPYPEEWQKILPEAVTFNRLQLKDLNESYTAYLAKVISNFITKSKIKDLDAVCSHGHTIKHEPENGFSLQIGNLPQLAKILGKTVVCDFRVQDVKLGGQGAPLVPIGDMLLLSKYNYCINLGGFANVSSTINGERIAFDICPVNTVLNHLAGKLGFPYDDHGKISASGNLDVSFLEKLNSLVFYSEAPPKSLGIEWVNRYIFPLLSKMENIPTALHTFTVHAATQITKILNQDSPSKVLVTGGGAFNDFLMKEIEKRTRNEIIVPSPEIVNYKEAMIFGFLGVLKLRNEVNVLKSVTGASRDHSSGVIFIP